VTGDGGMFREITLERDVQVPMRDGVVLRADVYRAGRNGRAITECCCSGTRTARLGRRGSSSSTPPGTRERGTSWPYRTRAAASRPRASSSPTGTRRETGPTRSAGRLRCRGRTAASADEQDVADLLKNGNVNHKLRIAVDPGVEPVAAIQLGTINPALYYRVDHALGT